MIDGFACLAGLGNSEPSTLLLWEASLILRNISHTTLCRYPLSKVKLVLLFLNETPQIILLSFPVFLLTV